MIPRLWYLTDGERGTGGRDQLEVIRQAVEGGVEAVLLRERARPDAEIGALIRSLEPLRRSGLKVLVSRRLDLLRAYQLDGVQLAADAVPVSLARKWLGPDALIGYSAHSGVEARQVASDGASYAMLSPIYSTESKPGMAGRGSAWLAEALRGIDIPVVALGGLTPGRTREILKAGAGGAAAVSAIGAAPDVAEAARAFSEAMTEGR